MSRSGAWRDQCGNVRVGARYRCSQRGVSGMRPQRLAARRTRRNCEEIARSAGDEDDRHGHDVDGGAVLRALLEYLDRSVLSLLDEEGQLGRELASTAGAAGRGGEPRGDLETATVEDPDMNGGLEDVCGTGDRHRAYDLFAGGGLLHDDGGLPA